METIVIPVHLNGLHADIHISPDSTVADLERSVSGAFGVPLFSSSSSSSSSSSPPSSPLDTSLTLLHNGEALTKTDLCSTSLTSDSTLEVILGTQCRAWHLLKTRYNIGQPLWGDVLAALQSTPYDKNVVLLLLQSAPMERPEFLPYGVLRSLVRSGHYEAVAVAEGLFSTPLPVAKELLWEVGRDTPCGHDVADVKMVLILSRLGTPWGCDALGMTALHLSVLDGRVGVLQGLYTAYGPAILDATDRLGHTALHLASGRPGAQQSASLNWLISWGASLSVKDLRGRTALLCACEVGASYAVEALLKAGADVADVDNVGVNTVLAAVNGGHYKLLKSLVTHGANINHEDRAGCGAYVYVAQSPCAVAEQYRTKEELRRLDLQEDASQIHLEVGCIEQFDVEDEEDEGEYYTEDWGGYCAQCVLQ